MDFIATALQLLHMSFINYPRTAFKQKFVCCSVKLLCNRACGT